MESNAQMANEEDIANSYYLTTCDNIDMVAGDGFGQNGQLQQIVQLIPQTFDKRQMLMTQPSSPKYSVASSAGDAVTFTQPDGNMTMPIVDGQLSLFESGGQQYLILPSFGLGPTQQIILQDQPNSQPAVRLVTDPQLEPLGVSSTVPQLTNLRSVSTVADSSLLTSMPQSRQQANITKPLPAPPVTSAGPVFPQGGVLQFHDRVRKKTEQVQSDKLDMLHIIPSLYQRTVLQETQADGPKACKYCSFRSDDQRELDKHCEKHSKDEEKISFHGKNSKKKKGRNYIVKKRKTAHMIRTSGNEEKEISPLPANCEICSATLSTIRQYRNHMKQHQNEKPHRCDKCNESFNKERNLNLHKSLHQTLITEGDREKYQCPECKKTFSRMAGLKMHISMHAEEETFMCKECGDEFNLNSELQTHLAEHDNDLERHLHDKSKGISVLIQAECDYEDEQGGGDRTITVNIEDIPDDLSRIQPTITQIHQQEQVVPSDKAANKTYSKCTKKRVRLVPRAILDSSTATHECTTCGKAFQKKSQLTRHNRIHTGEKPYSCSICNRAFNQKSAMQTHYMSMHSGEKPYTCPFCPQSYAQRGNLRIHVYRVHTSDEAFFACNLCPCSFKKLGSLNAHLTKYHPVANLAEPRVIGSYPKAQPDATGGQSVAQSGEPPLRGCGNNSANFVTSVFENSDAIDVNPQGVTTDIVHQALEECDVQNATLSESDTAFNGLVESNLGLPSEGLEVEKDTSTILDIEIATVVNEDKDTEQPSEEMSVQEDNATQCETGNSATSQPVEDIGISVPDTVQPRQKSNSTRQSTVNSLPPVTAIRTIGMNKWKVRRVAGVRWHQCAYCPKEFRKPSDLVRHVRVHTLERPYKCRTCFRAFSVKSSLTTHIKTHLGIKPHKCQVCLKCFTTAGSLKVHLRMHTGSKPFHCPHCERRFRTSGHRKAHITSHLRKSSSLQTSQLRKVPRKRISIDVSQFPLQAPLFITEEGIVQPHRGKDSSTLMRNDPLRPFKCDKCGKAFKKSNHLKQHTRSHTGEKPYTCDQCKRSFISTGILKAHLKTHLGINAYRCTLCNQAFSTNGSLKRHALIHSDSRPFMCPYCRKTFKSLVNCRKHIKTHRGELATQVNNGMQNLSQDLALQTTQSTLNSESTISGLPTVEETLNSTYIGDFDDTHDMSDPNLKQLTPNMMQDIQSLADPVQSTDHQRPFILPPPVQQEVVTHDVEMRTQLNNTAPLSLEELAGLTIPVESNTQLLTQHEQVQISHGQEELSLFGLDMTPQDSSGGNMSVPGGQQLYSNTMSLLENLNSQPQTSLPGIQISQPTTQAQPVESVLTVNPNLAPKRSAVGRSKRRKKYFGAKPIEVNSKPMYQCLGCEGVYKQQEFDDHIRGFKKSAKDLPFLCEYCCHRFKDSTHLESHSKFHGVDSGMVFKCSSCGVGFINKNILEEHEKTHKEEEPESLPSKRKRCSINTENPGTPHAQRNLGRSNFFRLTEEQSRILSKTNPNLHMTVSERVLLSAVAEKDRVTDRVVQKRGRQKAPEIDGYKHKNVCPHCPKSFQKKNDLVRHIRTHTGDKPFACTQCGKRFAVKSYLFCHEKTHSGIKSFRCHICNLMYAAKTSLKVHMRLHTGATPYKCPHCPLKFRTSGHRKSHMDSHSATKSSPKKKKKETQAQKKTKDEQKCSQKSRSSKPQSNPPQNPVMLSDVTLTLPDGVLNSGLLQVLQGSENLQLQWNGQTLQLMSSGSAADGENFAVHIDPTALQQSSNGQLHTATQDEIRKYTQSDASGPAPNLVIHPIIIADRQVDGGSGASELTNAHEINVAVPASLAPLTQQLFQSPVTSSSQQNEVTLNVNNLAVLQALQQLCNNNVTSGPVGQGKQDDLNLTVNQDDMLENQSLLTSGGFAFELLSTEGQTAGNQQFNIAFNDGTMLTTSTS